MRDPRTEPVPGDIITSSGNAWGLRCFVKVHEVKNGRVYYERGWRESADLLNNGSTDLCYMELESWKRACEDLGAAVEEVADVASGCC